MNCADVCLDMDYDADDNEFYVEVTVKSRKPHVCCECGERIPTRTAYQRATGKSDGRVWTAKTCLACVELRKTFVCGSWMFGALREEIENVMFPIWDESGPFDCLSKLETLEARRKINGWYANWKQ